jgi:hypothetical protein
MSILDQLPSVPGISGDPGPAGPASGDLQVRTYREGTTGLTAMVSEADAAARGRAGFVVVERTWEGTSLTLTYQRLPSPQAVPHGHVAHGLRDA